MPGLVAFGRRWQFGSDDFVLPSLFELILRVAWLIASAIIFIKHNSNLDCEGGDYLRLFLYGNFIVLLLIILSLIALIQNSMSGVIMDQDSRKYVTHSLYFRLFLEIPELVWNSLGTFWVFDISSCNTEAPDTVFLIKGIVISNWTLILIMVIGIAFVFDPLGSSQATLEDEAYERFEHRFFRNTRTARVWERRCKFLLCSCLQRNDAMSKSAFKDIGKIMGMLFDDVDLVPSDIAAGLILLHMKNISEENTLGKIDGGDPNLNVNQSDFESSSQSSQQSTRIFHQIDENDYTHSPELVCHFMKFSLGSYGWPWFLVANVKTGLCKLWKNLLCCGCCVSHPCAIEGDNCCFCNYSALKHTISIENEDLIYATFKNDVFQTPFYCVLDHKTQSIVLAIRGTLSLQDTVTDLNAEAKVFELDSLPPDCKAHNGMMQAARNVLDKINSLGILASATANYPNYNLVLTGHSLGAGTASILAILLKPKYPNLKCYAFSPPGGLMNLTAAVYCEDFITSVILGEDIVGRLSVPAFESFKQELINVLKSCKTPKYQILVGGCLYYLVGAKKPRVTYANTIEESASSSNLLPHEHTNYQTYVSLAEVSYRLQRESITREILYPPGKIIHITQRPIFTSRPDLIESPRFDYKWAKRNDFREIRVTPSLLTDHYPDSVYNALMDIASSSSHHRSVI